MLNRTFLKLFFILLLSVQFNNLYAHAHSGRTNSSGCHAGSVPRHCHNDGTPSGNSSKNIFKGIGGLFKSLKGADAKKPNDTPVPQELDTLGTRYPDSGHDGAINLREIRMRSPEKASTGNEAIELKPLDKNPFYSGFCEHIGGETNVHIRYTGVSGKKHLFAHCVTASTAWFATLDSMQDKAAVKDSIFMGNLLEKQPALVIFDTDGNIGNFELALIIAAHKVGIYYSIVNLNHYK